MFHSKKPIWLVIVAAAVVFGCGPDLPRTVPVTGTIVYKGKPVEAAEVVFLREGERPGRGLTDAQGRFELTTYYSADYDALEGVVPGEYKVKVTKMEFLVKPEDKSFGEFMARTGGKPPKSLLPLRYSDPKTTDLRAQVTEDGENHFAFVLPD